MVRDSEKKKKKKKNIKKKKKRYNSNLVSFFCFLLAFKKCQTIYSNQFVDLILPGIILSDT